MDYSFLVGIHDADRHESEGQESESENDLSENDILTPDDSGADTPPDSPSTRPKHVTIGDFDPCIDVYAIKSFESEIFYLKIQYQSNVKEVYGNSSLRSKEVCEHCHPIRSRKAAVCIWITFQDTFQYYSK